MDAINDTNEPGRACGAALIVAFAVCVQPMIAASTLIRNFDPPKSIVLSFFIFTICAIEAARGNLSRHAKHLWTRFPAATLLAIGCFITITAGLIFSPEPWTGLLGAFPRRQGWITECTELFVLLAAMIAAATGAVPPHVFARFVVIGAAGASASAVCQSHWVFFLDPTKWNNETFNRVAGSMGSASQLSTWLAATIPLTFGLLVYEWRHGRKSGAIAAALTLVVEIVAIFFARGRSGFAGAMAGIVLFLILYNPATAIARIASRACFGFLLLLGALILAMNAPGHPFDKYLESSNFVTHLLQRLAHVSDFDEGGGRIRVLLGDATIRAVESRPASILVGYGPDGHWAALAPFDSPERSEIEGGKSSQTPPDRPHQFLAERVLTGGAGYALAWSCLLGLAVASSLATLKLIENKRAFLLIIIGAGAAAGIGYYYISGSFSLVMAAAPLGSAAAILLFAVVHRIRGWFRAPRETERSADEPILLSFAGAVVAHWIAGSVGVSMAPERTLLWAVAGIAIGREWYLTNRTPAPDSGPAAADPGSDGFFVGSVCAAALPLYAFYAFRWQPLPDPMYAAAIVPFIILITSLAFQRSHRIRIALESLVIMGAIGLNLYICSKWTSGGGFDAIMDYRPMSIFAPVSFMIVCLGAILYLSHSAAGRSNPGSMAVRAALFLIFTALAAGYGWIGICEMRAESMYAAYFQVNNAAVRAEDEANHTIEETRHDELMRWALQLNDKANGILEEVKSVGAPLAPFGCPSVVDRQVATTQKR